MFVAMNQCSPLDLRNGGDQGIYQRQPARRAAAQYQSGPCGSRIHRGYFSKEKLVGSQGSFDFLLCRP